MHILLHKKDRNATLVDLADDVEVLLDEKRRQAERRLVDQQQFRRPHQAPADRDHRLLAARHGAGELHPTLRQAREQAEDFRHALLCNWIRWSLVSAEAQLLLDRKLGTDFAAFRDTGHARGYDLVRR